MDHSKVQATTDVCQLLVRHLPQWLTQEEKESFLSHFGAAEVISMPPRGKMKNCVFATFATSEDARRALNKLHQLELFGSRLVVEFARPRHSVEMDGAQRDKWECNTSKLPVGDVDLDDSEDKPPLPKSSPASEDLPPPPSLCYLFPPPTPTVLNNISNALTCVPKLYVQVLHLMNKMNLPPPFGPPTPTPPLPPDTTPSHPSLHPPPSPSSASSCEEEIESDEETKKGLVTRLSEPRRVVKRRAVSFKQVKNLMPAAKRQQFSDAEQPLLAPAKRIEIHVPKEIITPSVLPSVQEVTHIEQKQPVLPLTSEQKGVNVHEDIQLTMESTPHTAVSSGVEATPGAAVVDSKLRESNLVAVWDEKEQQFEEHSAGLVETGLDNEGGNKRRFISQAELTAHRLTDEEIRKEHVFNNYSRGEPSLRLYIKNLTKQTSEDDLHYIFGRYIDWNSEEEKNMFDVRLMQFGRMKGQAFVGLPSERAAIKAVRETNGYVLHGKPMIVQFARTTKAKDQDK